MKGLSPARRKKVEARAAELISEEMSLRDLRRARKLTQVHMAMALVITQDSVLRLEQRSDLLLSTLRKTQPVHNRRISRPQTRDALRHSGPRYKPDADIPQTP
jgi:hypothetical protein